LTWVSHRSNHHGSLFQSGRERAGAFPTQIHSASGGPPPKNAMDLVVCQTLTKKDEYRRHLPHSLSEKTTLAAGTFPLDNKIPALAGTCPAQNTNETSYRSSSLDYQQSPPTKKTSSAATPQPRQPVCPHAQHTAKDQRSIGVPPARGQSETPYR